MCVRTPAFVRSTTALSRPALPADVRDAFAVPYGDASRRHAVGDFVADIPLEPDHPSAATLDAVAAGLRGLAVPALLAKVYVGWMTFAVLLSKVTTPIFMGVTYFLSKGNFSGRG